MKKLIAILLLTAMALLGSAGAFAEELELTGTITATQMETLTAPAAGKVEMCSVMAGDHVEAGNTLITLQTTKVYAEQDGVVRIFGEPGDSADAIVQRYGGLAYLEPSVRYTIAGSTKNAYGSDDARLVHAGEKVYLRNSNNYNQKDTGTVTIVSGTSYTVEVDGNSFASGSTINIYRTPDFAAASMIGNGKVSQASPLVYTGTGYLVRWHVKNAQQVKAGDLLFETLEGSFVPGSSMNQIVADKPGVIASVSTNKGRKVAADEALIDFYPDEALRIVASVAESDLALLKTGMSVQILLPGEEDSAPSHSGTIEKISLLAQDNSTAYGTSYAVYIIPDTTDMLRYGMNVTVIIP